MAKLAAGIADTAVTMAAKAHLRNGRPVVVAVSTNDGLGGAARNIGELLSRKHYYFVPFRQDDPVGKPTSLVAEMGLVTATVAAALRGEQIQPLLLGPAGAVPPGPSVLWPARSRSLVLAVVAHCSGRWAISAPICVP